MSHTQTWGPLPPLPDGAPAQGPSLLTALAPAHDDAACINPSGLKLSGKGWSRTSFRECQRLLLKATDAQCARLLPVMRAVLSYE